MTTWKLISENRISKLDNNWKILVQSIVRHLTMYETQWMLLNVEQPAF